MDSRLRGNDDWARGMTVGPRNEHWVWELNHLNCNAVPEDWPTDGGAVNMVTSHAKRINNDLPGPGRALPLQNQMTTGIMANANNIPDFVSRFDRSCSSTVHCFALGWTLTLNSCL